VSIIISLEELLALLLGAGNKGEDAGCTELLLVACKEAVSAELLLLGAGKAVSAELLLGAGNEAVSADLLLVALDSTSSTIIFASSSSACNKGEDAGCTELMLVACKEAVSAELLLLGAGKAVSAELLLVALDSTSSTIIFASSSSACKKDEDAGCTELD